MELLNALVEAIGWSLLHFIWQGLVVGLSHEGALRLAASKSPQLRYAISLSSLLVLAAVPVATFITEWKNRVPLPVAGADEPVLDGITAFILSTGTTNPVPESLDAWLAYIVSAWLIGVVVLSARFGLGILSLRRLAQNADFGAVSDWMRDELERLRQHMGVSRGVRIALSTQVGSPMVTGWLRPIIFLPLSAATGLDHQQIRMVLAHELAHLRRHDALVNLIQVVMETLLFYHPAVYRISKSLRQEREQCCDDLAVAVGGNRIAYARLLAELEEMRQNDRRDALALGIVTHELYARVERLVGNKSAESKQGQWLPVLLVALGGLMLTGKTIDFDAPLLPSLFEQTSKRQQFPLALPNAVARPFVPISEPVRQQPELEKSARDARTQRSTTTPVAVAQQERESVTATNETELQATPGVKRSPKAEAKSEPTPAVAKNDDDKVSHQPVTPVLAGGELIAMQQPTYPRQALRSDKEGQVQLAFTITADGHVNEIEVVNSEPRGLFEAAAINAVSSWRYRPFTENGVPVSKRASQVLEFRLSENPPKRSGTSSRDCREQTGTRLCRAVDDADTQLTILRN